MKTTEDLTWEEQKALQRQLNLCARNLQKLVDMARDIVGPEGNVYMDASTALYVMDGDAHSGANAGDRQRHVLLESKLIKGRIGAGDW